MPQLGHNVSTMSTPAPVFAPLHVPDVRSSRNRLCLGNTAEIASAPSSTAIPEETPTPAHYLRRRMLERLQRRASALIGGRVAQCGSKIPGRAVLRVVADSRAYVQGVRRCGNAWMCLVCAGRLQVARRSEIQRAITSINQKGWAGLFITLTVQHVAADPLETVLERLDTLTRSIWEGRRRYSWMAHLPQYTGRIAAFQMTYGRSGFHPHQHLLVLFENTPTADQISNAVTDLRRIAASTSAAHDLKLIPEIAVDVQVVAADDAAGTLNYLLRAVGSYITPDDLDPSSKGTRAGVSLGKLLDTDPQLWKSAVKVLKGRHGLQYSRGLKSALGMLDTPHLSENTPVVLDTPVAEHILDISAEYPALRNFRGVADVEYLAVIAPETRDDREVIAHLIQSKVDEYRAIFEARRRRFKESFRAETVSGLA